MCTPKNELIHIVYLTFRIDLYILLMNYTRVIASANAARRATAEVNAVPMAADPLEPPIGSPSTKRGEAEAEANIDAEAATALGRREFDPVKRVGSGVGVPEAVLLSDENPEGEADGGLARENERWRYSTPATPVGSCAPAKGTTPITHTPLPLGPWGTGGAS